MGRLFKDGGHSGAVWFRDHRAQLSVGIDGEQIVLRLIDVELTAAGAEP